MKVYLAGTPGTKERERRWQATLQARLLSYWDIQQDQFNVPYAFNLITKKSEDYARN